MIRYPSKVTICEVGPRDGLQSFGRKIPTDVKVRMIDRLSATGLPVIEATGFVHPKMIPHLDDAEEVMARIRRRPGTIYRGLAPNERGAERAVAAGVDEVVGLITVSKTYLAKNQNMNLDRAVEQALAVHEIAIAAGKRHAMAIGMAMWCPYEGRIPETEVIAILDRFYDSGMRNMYLAGSMGMEDPRHVGALFAACVARYPDVTFGYHVHNMSGMATANILAALDAGVSFLEGSICGLGGAVAAVATGNLPTEDIVAMMTELGVSTGVELAEITAAALDIAQLLEIEPKSFVCRSGTRAEISARAVSWSP
ncbi:MAG: hmgcL [Candidatus Eremiobacteraeota bacterium]|nr:hmgcL [Candidatus Eremiobacteraeota bacterium]